MKKFLSSIFTAVPLVLAVAGLSFGQTAATATWPLDSTANVNVTGSVSAMTESITGLQSAYEVPPAGTTDHVQKLKPDATTSSSSGTGAWPTETAPNGGRYTEFSVAPQSNFNLTVNSISMFIGNKGIKGMNATIYYSTNSNFADSTKLVELDSLFENGVIDTTFSGLNLAVSSGETLYIRAYPWLSSSSTSTSKYFYIGNVVVSGTTTAMPNPSLSTTLDWNFQSDAIGESLLHIGWSQSDIQAVVADDPVNPGQGNNVLKCVVHNYNAAPVLEAVLPSGKTLADYDSLTFQGYFAQGDVGYKDIIVEAYQTKPTGQAFNNTSVKIGDYNRSKMGSTNWENISIPISGSASMTDTVYLAFGINCAGTGSVGAAGDTTIWYADNIKLVAKQTQPGGPTLVSNWGTTPMGQDNGWTISNTASTPAGSAAMGGTAAPTGWMTIKGGFDSVTATTSQAFVITGNLQFVGGGGGSAYTWLRYALFEGNGTLSNQNTDSARWSGTTGGYGYIFTPVSGSGIISNTYHSWPQGNQGTEWPLINSGSWISTNSNGGGPFSTILQAPYHQVADSGTYNWAISVQPLSTGGNEVNWYLIQQHAAGSNNYYWWGGSFVDTAATAPTSFNSIGFAVNNDNTATQLKLSNVTVSLGSPVTVPVAPFQPFYVSAWGSTPMGSAWPILNDSTYVDGDAAMGNGSTTTGWATILGGFQQTVTASTDKAVNITGKLEFVGGGGASAYTWLRYALFDGNDTLKYQNTDSAKWLATTNGNGYIFTPVSGSGIISNTYHSWPQGNQGTEWPLINSGSWISTNSNGGGPFSTVLQAPYHQVAAAGVYDWAISVQPLSSGGNEVRWYLIQEHTSGSNNYYWWGGSFIDTAKAAPTSFNSIGFAVNNDNTATEVKITDVEVTKGAPITVPEAPFQSFYVNMWGATSVGSSWPILNDSTYVDGDAAMGNGSITTAWSSIRGGFQAGTITASTDKAFNITGKLEFVGGGGGSAYTWLRYALFNGDGTLTNQNTDSAFWTGATTANGYIFTPVSGGGTISNTYHSWPQGNQGTEWALNNSASWNSTNNNNGGPFSTILQAPYHQAATAGVYDWAISVQPLSTGGTEVKWYLIQEHATGSSNYYWWGGSFVDTSATAPISFNSIGFSVNNDNTATEVKLTDVEVTEGTAITIPKKPFSSFYIPVANWGFFGDPATRMGGWKLTPGELDGNVSISGSGPVAANQWAAVRGGFQGTVALADLPPDTALVITGSMQFVGGGFDGWSGLRMGIFYSDSAGVVDSTQQYGQMWTGKDSYSSGYLICPNSGTNANPTWGSNGSGSVGGVENSTWLSTNGANDYILSNMTTSDVAGAGTYDFIISVKPMSNGNVALGYSIKGPSYSFVGDTIDTHSPVATTKFNAIDFAVSSTNANTTALNITNVQVALGSPVVTSVNDKNNNSLLPTVYSLSQNYPNPFNPSTTIQFALPKSGNVTLKIYDILGRLVKTLVSGQLNAGYHTVNFNADNLASGVYFYRLKAGNFISVKKLMLLK